MSLNEHLNSIILERIIEYNTTQPQNSTAKESNATSEMEKHMERKSKVTCSQVRDVVRKCDVIASPPACLMKTRRLAACTQAVIILRSTSYIAIELKCSAFEVVRNSIESMCLLSYSAFDCILLESINSLLLVHGPLGRKMSQDRNVSLRTF